MKLSAPIALVPLVLGAAPISAACGGSPEPAPPPTTPAPPVVPSQEVAMNAALSPSGEPHPGEIVNEDKIDGRTWTSKAAEVPPTIGWVKVGDVWEAVVRIEITGAPGQRRVTKFGRAGQMLESTVQAPPPRRPPPTPTPTPMPTPEDEP